MPQSAGVCLHDFRTALAMLAMLWLVFGRSPHSNIPDRGNAVFLYFSAYASGPPAKLGGLQGKTKSVRSSPFSVSGIS